MKENPCADSGLLDQSRRMLSAGGRIEPKRYFFCSCIKVKPLSYSVSAVRVAQWCNLPLQTCMI